MVINFSLCCILFRLLSSYAQKQSSLTNCVHKMRCQGLLEPDNENLYVPSFILIVVNCI